MELIADILLIFGALAATIYCVILSRRLRRFTDLEKGVGGAIAVLSVQVDDMTRTLGVAQVSAVGSAQSLDQLTTKAEAAARRLELLVAAMHDIPEQTAARSPKSDQADQQEPAPTESVQPEPAQPADPAPPQPDPQIPAATADEPGPVFLSQRNQIKEAAE